jgi:hypothetical protein
MTAFSLLTNHGVSRDSVFHPYQDCNSRAAQNHFRGLFVLPGSTGNGKQLLQLVDSCHVIHVLIKRQLTSTVLRLLAQPRILGFCASPFRITFRPRNFPSSVKIRSAPGNLHQDQRR